jgi:hypothetical protein
VIVAVRTGLCVISGCELVSVARITVSYRVAAEEPSATDMRIRNPIP